mmetsp:Transcript_3062/g.10188  ORF Transcript_3062/g.10188 Transcript_3062/m.10188 type:complete len:258 (+) Transcript_3062:105-878(+)
MSSERPVVTIKASELKAEFERASGGDGSIDFSEIGAIEMKFGIALSISADMKYWRGDMKVTYCEFVDMLKRNGNIASKEGGGDVKLQVSRSDIDVAFAEAGGSDGIIDFEDIGKVEKKYGLPMNISGDMKYWKDMKITKDEFIEMLERNGNLVPESEAAPVARELPAEALAQAPAVPPQPATAPSGDGGGPRERAKALFRQHAGSPDDTLSLSTLNQVVQELGGMDWPEGRLTALLKPHTKDGRVQIGAFLDWVFAA